MEAWFDHWLKGKPLREFTGDPVRLFRMGGADGSRTTAGRFHHGGEWTTTTAWPPPDARPVRYFIQNGGVLATSAASSAEARHYVFDPDNPVPSIGGRYANGGTPGCAQDQVCNPKIPGCKDSLPLNQRADVLSYSTPPLEAPLTVTGKLRARLWISSDAPDTDFTAKLIDVYPNGYALILADGQIRARYRSGFERAQMLEPGRVYPVDIDLASTSNLFAAGHRIRLDISSSNYPKFDPNPNTGEAAGRWTRRVKARNSVWHGGARASYVELPVVGRR